MTPVKECPLLYGEADTFDRLPPWCRIIRWLKSTWYIRDRGRGEEVFTRNKVPKSERERERDERMARRNSRFNDFSSLINLFLVIMTQDLSSCESIVFLVNYIHRWYFYRWYVPISSNGTNLNKLISNNFYILQRRKKS